MPDAGTHTAGAEAVRAPRRLTKDEQIAYVPVPLTCERPLKRGGTCSQWATWLIPTGLRVCSIHKREWEQRHYEDTRAAALLAEASS